MHGTWTEWFGGDEATPTPGGNYAHLVGAKPIGLMILSTVALRYHSVMDVLAGTALAWPAVWLCDRLQAMDGEADESASPSGEPG